MLRAESDILYQWFINFAIHPLVDSIGDGKSMKDAKPPLPKVHSTPKKLSTTPRTLDSGKKPTEKLIKSARASPRVTPKATPLQSPAVEHSPLSIHEAAPEIIRQKEKKHRESKVVKQEEKSEEKQDHGTEKAEVSFFYEIPYW